MTLINYHTTFELYDSSGLTVNPWSLINYGETRPIVGFLRSLETDHTGSLTYGQSNSQIKKAYIYADGLV